MNEPELIAYLKTVGEMMPGGLADFVRKQGILFQSAPRPKGLRKQRDGQCFANAWRLANDKNLIYCEGYALRIIDILHAWCVTPEGVVVDNTWKDPQACAYYGIPLNLEYVNAALVRGKVFGLLGNPATVGRMMKADPALYLHPAHAHLLARSTLLRQGL